ncbi:MAG: hypothetical protein WC455_10235 [Dehalococcoidia bacterium]|jgi:Fe2+ or Zn2+ uptake regulation protein
MPYVLALVIPFFITYAYLSVRCRHAFEIEDLSGDFICRKCGTIKHLHVWEEVETLDIIRSDSGDVTKDTRKIGMTTVSVCRKCKDTKSSWFSIDKR